MFKGQTTDWWVTNENCVEWNKYSKDRQMNRHMEIFNTKQDLVQKVGSVKTHTLKLNTFYSDWNMSN